MYPLMDSPALVDYREVLCVGSMGAYPLSLVRSAKLSSPVVEKALPRLSFSPDPSLCSVL